MRRLLFKLGLALMLCPRNAAAISISSRQTSTPQPGITLVTGRTASPSTRFWALQIDLCLPHLKVDATAPARSRRSPGSWATERGAQAAVNGDFFRTDTATPIVYGLAAGGGRAWPLAQTGLDPAFADEWYVQRQAWFAFGEGWVDFDHSKWVKRNLPITQGFHLDRLVADLPPGTRALVSGFPELITEGRVYTCASPTADDCFPDRSDMRARHPRTAMGLSADRGTLFLAVVDGRSNVSTGMYGTELSWLMSELGAWQAVNLDGGGSSALWIEGLGNVNTPSDGSARSVANHLGVLTGDAGGQPWTPGSCLNVPTTPESCFVGDPTGGTCAASVLSLNGGSGSAGPSTDIDGDGRADVCARGSNGVLCARSTEVGLEAAFEPGVVIVDALTNARGWSDLSNALTVRYGDLDGDLRADVCARANDGLRCVLAAGGEVVNLPDYSDAAGFSRPTAFTTLHLADVTGDGRADVCARGPMGMSCSPFEGPGFGATIPGPAWSDALGFGTPDTAGTFRMADVDGDGRADACIRSPNGVRCVFASDAFAGVLDGPALTDAEGYLSPGLWSTLRLADVDGDGRADLCATTASDLRCYLSIGRGFAPLPLTLSNVVEAEGWDRHEHYATLRSGDLDGDGADELCLRLAGGLRCYFVSDRGVRELRTDLLSIPGWSAPSKYLTMRLADVTGDGRDDLCARGEAGLHCWASTGDGFAEPAVLVPSFSTENGFGDASAFSSLHVAGGRAAVPPPERDLGLAIRDGLAPHTDASVFDGQDALLDGRSDGAESRDFAAGRRDDAGGLDDARRRDDAGGLDDAVFRDGRQPAGDSGRALADARQIAYSGGCALSSNAHTRGVGLFALAALFLVTARRRSRSASVGSRRSRDESRS